MPPSRRCVVFSRRYGRAEKLRIPCAILISEDVWVFGHFHAHWREPVNRDRRSVHDGARKVTESRFPIDVQQEMRLRTKGGTVSWSSASHHDSAALN